MKTLFSALLFTMALSAQTVTVTFSGFQPAVLTDINQHWLNQAGPVFGASSAALDATTASVTVVVSQASLSALQPIPAVGQSILCDGEPMTVTGISMQYTLTLGRGVFPIDQLIAHPNGCSALTTLTYVNPWQMMVAEAIRPWAEGLTNQLGSKSVTFGVMATGAITQ